MVWYEQFGVGPGSRTQVPHYGDTEVVRPIVEDETHKEQRRSSRFLRLRFEEVLHFKRKESGFSITQEQVDYFTHTLELYLSILNILWVLLLPYLCGASGHYVVQAASGNRTNLGSILDHSLPVLNNKFQVWKSFYQDGDDRSHATTNVHYQRALREGSPVKTWSTRRVRCIKENRRKYTMQRSLWRGDLRCSHRGSESPQPRFVPRAFEPVEKSVCRVKSTRERRFFWVIAECSSRILQRFCQIWRCLGYFIRTASRRLGSIDG